VDNAPEQPIPEKPSFPELLQIFPEIRVAAKFCRHYFREARERHNALGRERLQVRLKKMYEEKNGEWMTGFVKRINAWAKTIRLRSEEGITWKFTPDQLEKTKRVSSVLIIGLYKRDEKTLERERKKWEKITRQIEWTRKPKKTGEITDSDIVRAKEMPLRDFVSPNRAGFIRCPFHDEKTPSCKIFKDNRFYCFGCGANGDVIDYAMKTFQLEFLPAVRKILGK